MDHLHELAQGAKQAARQLALYDTKTKNNALRAIADGLEANCEAILDANAHDVEMPGPMACAKPWWTAYS